MKVIIADDEELARQELKHLLGNFDDVDIVAEASNGPGAWEAIVEHNPDVAFLDIHMPGLSGMEVAHALREMEKPPRIVFVTAFDQYALEAFETEAVDYVLKPIETDRLASTVERLRRAVPARDTGLVKKIEDIMTRFGKGKAATPRRLSMKKGARTQLVDPSSVLFMSVEEGVVKAVTDDFTGLLPYRSLDEAERDLGDSNFFRTCRTHLVNIDRIKEIQKAKEGTWELVLDNRETLPLSRAQSRKLRKLIKW